MARSNDASRAKNDPLRTLIGKRRFRRHIPIEKVEEAAESDANLHFAKVKVSSDYRIVIPREIRSSLKLKPGQKIAIVVKDRTLLLIPIRP